MIKHEDYLQAVADMKRVRRYHLDSARELSRYLMNDRFVAFRILVRRSGGGVGYHRACVARYDRVLAVLKQIPKLAHQRPRKVT